MANQFLLAIDQGTTSSRVVLYNEKLEPQASKQKEFPQIFPRDGWVEHDAETIFSDVQSLCNEVLSDLSAGDEIVAIGLTNQRETTVVWDRKSGKPIYHAIVWQDRRTAEYCMKLKESGLEDLFQDRTGLLLDPYFSGTKLAWILDSVPDAREQAEQGNLAFGTIDSWLIWKLTGGKSHVTDATNAARTLLFNINDGIWDEEILETLRIPKSLLPEVRDCAGIFGTSSSSVLSREVPILGVAGDQQAATVGQACFSPGMMKATYGTGCFALLNTGDEKINSTNKLLGTLAYQVGGKRTYALEGSIFMAGATIQWLRDGLKILPSAPDSEGMCKTANPGSRVMMVPAFTGLGAPYWDPDARGAILGMTRDTGQEEIVKAAVESVSYQTRDLMEAMSADISGDFDEDAPLRVDGGMVANDWFLQDLADVLGRPVQRPVNIETTALGAVGLAALGAGLYSDLADLASSWRPDSIFEPRISKDERDDRYGGWRRAVQRVLSG